ncbi:MAG TPA: ADYC domain-containing protein [Kofleriaceae bacterium]
MLLLLGACSGPELGFVEQGIGCPKEVCGTNSCEIDMMGFHDLDMTRGRPNADGFLITGFEQAGRDYEVVVANAQLTGTGIHGTISGAGLVGAQILLDHHGTTYAIRIAAVDTLRFPIPATAGQPTVVETYELDYAEMNGAQPVSEWKNICGGTAFDDGGDGEYGYAETFGQNPKHSLMFESDRIDLTTMTIDPTPQPQWFNIGCSGHTLAKLFLTRNASASQGHSGDHAGRQASLKLLVGDYCGKGKPFTVPGQRLAWMGGQMTYFSAPGRLEARWSEHGAVCLEQPRMARPTTVEGEKMFPDIESAIATECKRPPLCEERSPYDFAGALRVSANY